MADLEVPGLAPEAQTPPIGPSASAAILEALLTRPGSVEGWGGHRGAPEQVGPTPAVAGPAAAGPPVARSGSPAPTGGLAGLTPDAYLGPLTGRRGRAAERRGEGGSPGPGGPGALPADLVSELAGPVRIEPDRRASSLPEIAQAEAESESYQRGTTEDVLREDDFSLPGALQVMLELRGSDLHLSTGAPPTVRIDGSLRPLPDFEPLTPEVIQRVMYAICTQQQRERFEETLELDFSYAIPGVARFRVNMYKQKDHVGGAFRVIPFEIKSLEQLGMPPVMANFAALPRGFVLVTGPTGSGKSTTLAALVDLANRTRAEHIMTVEDPIEFLHQHKKCLVNQREVGQDTTSFAQALKHVLRQDPDIILVGEMRDLETIQVALTAAETGHLVYATLHTQDAAQTIDRVIDVFPPSQQQQIRQQLAGTLQGIICQTLCKTTDGHGRAAATEVLVATPAIRNLIREGKTHQIYSALQAGASFGMHTLDQHLAELVRAGRVSMEVGLEKCHHVEDFTRMAGQQSKPAGRR